MSIPSDGIKKKRTLTLTIVIMCATLLVVISGCTSSGASDSPSIDCPDLTGSWTSEEYEALSVHSDGTHETLRSLTMTLEIVHQEKCHFHGINRWTNGEIGGEEQLAGVIDDDGSRITMVEVGEHPLGGTTGRILGQLVGDDQMRWEYAGLASDGTQGIVFITHINKD